MDYSAVDKFYGPDRSPAGGGKYLSKRLVILGRSHHLDPFYPQLSKHELDKRDEVVGRGILHGQQLPGDSQLLLQIIISTYAQWPPSCSSFLLQFSQINASISVERHTLAPLKVGGA